MLGSAVLKNHSRSRSRSPNAWRPRSPSDPPPRSRSRSPPSPPLSPRYTPRVYTSLDKVAVFPNREILEGEWTKFWLHDNPEEPNFNKELEEGVPTYVFVENVFDPHDIRGGRVNIPVGFDFARACAAAEEKNMSREAAFLVQVVVLLVDLGSRVTRETSKDGFLLKPDIDVFGLDWN